MCISLSTFGFGKGYMCISLSTFVFAQDIKPIGHGWYKNVGPVKIFEIS